MNDDLISRQDAIKAIEKLNIPEDMCVFEILSHITLAIETLPSVERDYKFDEWCTECKEYDQEKHCCPRFNHVIRTTLQEVQEDRKKGKWMYIDDDDWLYDTYKCTSCHREIMVDARRVDDIGIVIDDLDFCPYCGADMRGEQNDSV